jgi:nitroreductase
MVDSMNRIVLAAAAAALLGTGGAGATDTRTLSEFLVVCRSSPRTCHANIEDYLLAARDQGFVCLPQDLSLKDAASEELSWLRNDGAADAALKQGTAEDAQWTAINTLWPCKKE